MSTYPYDFECRCGGSVSGGVELWTQWQQAFREFWEIHKVCLNVPLDVTDDEPEPAQGG